MKSVFDEKKEKISMTTIRERSINLQNFLSFGQAVLWPVDNSLFYLANGYHGNKLPSFSLNFVV